MKPHKRKLCYRSVIVGLLALLSFVSYEWSSLVPNANAIPAFARKYGFSCNVCHVPGFPKLNDTGNIFRDQGYQLGTDGDLPTHEGITMGFWPVSMRTTVGYQAASVRTDGKGITTGGFGFTGLDILSFGSLHRDIAFGIVFTPGLGSAGFGTGASDSDLESAFVRLMRLERFVGVKSEPGDYLLNLKVGKFELDVPFSEKRSPTLNSVFAMYHYQPGTPFTSTISGTSTSSYLNPNSFEIGENSPGAEVAGIKKTAATSGYFRYSLAALSTNTFSGPLSGCPPGTTCGTGGRNVNFFGHMTQSFGGYGIVTGHRIGVFGAYGNAPTMVNATCPTCQAVAGSGQPFSRVGVDVSLTFDGQWNLFGAMMRGNDSKNMFVSQGIVNAQNASWNGAFVELDWYPTLLPLFDAPGWLFSYRYDVIRNDRQGDPTFAKNYNNVDSHTFLARYYIHQSSRTDIALHLEYNTYRTVGVGAANVVTPGSGTCAPACGNLLGQTMLAGLDFAF
ncbi:MAG: hypothetical protein KGJ82_20920 [Nitrospirota bacterium]|nr:hypothetical protein [Nitrospirota bacterium]MDE3219823.1 hypothetical protein [Nitrospirota bacterium]